MSKTPAAAAVTQCKHIYEKIEKIPALEPSRTFENIPILMSSREITGDFPALFGSDPGRTRLSSHTRDQY